jgi:signal transduction histidine kinase
MSRPSNNHALSNQAPSIRARLLRSVLLVVVAAATVCTIGAAWSISYVVARLMTSELEEAAQVLVVLAEHEAELEALTHDGVLPASPHREAIFWQLRSPDGKLVARSHDAPATPWDVPLFEGHVQTDELAVYTVAGQRLWLQAAQPLADLRAAQRQAAAQVVGIVLLLGIAAAVVLGWRIRVELQPVEELARDVGSVDPTMAATPMLPRSPRRELEPVYAALTALLHRLSQQLRSEHAFASHAAHSLRTPLAGLSAQLELAHLQASGELKPRLALALDAARRLNGVVAGLLAMARTHGPIAWQQFDARELGKVALGRRIASDVSALEMAAPLHGNLDLLATAVINLVDNAARHGASKVWIQSLPSAQVQQLRVTDDGPGASPERLAALRRALRSFNEQGEINPAIGLGLTLATAVARAHGGQVSVDCADSGAPGFCVQIAWPHTPDAAPDNAPTH